MKKEVLKIVLTINLIAAILMLNSSVCVNAGVDYSGKNPQLTVSPSVYTAYKGSNLPASIKNYGLKDAPVKLPEVKSIALTNVQSYSFPAYYDLRALGRVTSVKNQSSSGCCWAFAAYASLESNLLPEEYRDFSENNLKNNSGFDYSPNNTYGNHIMATAYLARWSGAVNESDDPYDPDSTSSPAGLTVQKHVQNVDWLPGRTDSLDNDFIKKALMESGAVYSTMYFDDNLDGSGCFNDAYDTYYSSTLGESNHAVAIVGWDDSFDKNKFIDSNNGTVPPGNGAFIVKNSWGTWWGDKGYFYVSYYDKNFAMYINALFNGAEDTSNYKSIYQYDPLGVDCYLTYKTDTGWMSNVFTASANEVLSAVSFYTLEPDTSYEVYICSDYTGKADLENNRVLKAAGSISEMGYHTVKLNSSVPLTSGKKFAVIIKNTTSGYECDMPIERPFSGYSSKASASPGQSYASYDGTDWSDVIYTVADTNLCIKAFTKPAVKVTSVSLNKTSLSLKAGDTDTLIASISPFDATNKNVTWKSSNNQIAAVNSTGKITAEGAGNAIITATTADGGYQASCSVSVSPRNVQVISLIGSNRYDTAVKISQNQFSSADTVLIVNGGAMADGLGAAPLAAFKKAPLLLTESNILPSETKNEIKRLKAGKAIIVGGPGVVSENVKSQLQGLGLAVERVWGSNRYGTSLEVVKYIDKNCYDVSEIVAANGYGEADALSIASAAGRDKMPIILVEKDNIPIDIYNWLKSESLQNAYIIGGTGVVTNNVLTKINEITSKDISNNRLGGLNRFETNSLVIDKFYGSIIDKTYIAKGYLLIDAMAAGPVAAINGSPVVLTDKDLTASQKTVLGKRYGDYIMRTGGGISDTAINTLKNCLQ